jgi:hypothetical protein
MTTGLPAWVAICAVLAVQVVPARAEDPPDAAPGAPVGDIEPRRPVAVIDLSGDESVNILSNALYTAINHSDVLRYPDNPGLVPFLVDKLYDEDSDNIKRAINDLTSAQSRLDEANAPGATTQARNGQIELAQVVPTPQVQALYADLSLVIGLAMLDEGRLQEATYAFALTHRMDPTRELDPARYPPDTVAAFKHASETKQKLVTVEITGTGHLWIDCADRGNAPAKLDDIEVGDHVITVSGFDRQTTALLPVQPSPAITDPPVPPHSATITASVALDVPELGADVARKVQRARLALSRAQAKGDDVARAGAMKQLATLLGVGDAIMISKRPDGKLQWETWRDRAPGFSAPKEFTNQKPEDILEGIAPPRRQLAIRSGVPVPFTPRLIPEQQWYEKGWVQISGATGVILVVAGVILLATREHAIDFGNGDIKASN